MHSDERKLKQMRRFMDNFILNRLRESNRRTLWIPLLRSPRSHVSVVRSSGAVPRLRSVAAVQTPGAEREFFMTSLVVAARRRRRRPVFRDVSRLRSFNTCGGGRIFINCACSDWRWLYDIAVFPREQKKIGFLHFEACRYIPSTDTTIP